jgi:fatty-acid peroxygenase
MVRQWQSGTYLARRQSIMPSTRSIPAQPAQASGKIPRLGQWDSTFPLLADPYRFIARNCLQQRSDVFETRLQLQPTLCMTGPKAAELFYDPMRFRRDGAAPEPLKATLFGKGAVQGLDGARHHQRKALLLSITSADRLADLEGHVRFNWERARRDWSATGRVTLYRALQPVLTRAVCDWAGVPLAESDTGRRTRQLTALFDGAASGLFNHVGARIARLRAERWLASLIEASRDQSAPLAAGSIARAVSEHQEERREALPPRIAAVELLNILRPTVAVSVYITFLAHALHAEPGWRKRLAEQLAGNDSGDALAFVQEVRRHYPFFPAVVARVRHPFDWNGMHFPPGRRTLLDLYGTDHDPRSWEDPFEFRPERWRGRQPGRFEFVPQGGGEAASGHRCPGEDLATRLMLLALQLLLQLRYEVPAQDLAIAMDRLPAIPREGFIIDRVRLP